MYFPSLEGLGKILTIWKTYKIFIMKMMRFAAHFYLWLCSDKFNRIVTAIIYQDTQSLCLHINTRWTLLPSTLSSSWCFIISLIYTNKGRNLQLTNSVNNFGLWDTSIWNIARNEQQNKVFGLNTFFYFEQTTLSVFIHFKGILFHAELSDSLHYM